MFTILTIHVMIKNVYIVRDCFWKNKYYTNSDTIIVYSSFQCSLPSVPLIRIVMEGKFICALQMEKWHFLTSDVEQLFSFNLVSLQSRPFLAKHTTKVKSSYLSHPDNHVKYRFGLCCYPFAASTYTVCLSPCKQIFWPTCFSNFWSQSCKIHHTPKGKAKLCIFPLLRKRFLVL